jgi:hypothetical protein
LNQEKGFFIFFILLPAAGKRGADIEADSMFLQGKQRSTWFCRIIYKPFIGREDLDLLEQKKKDTITKLCGGKNLKAPFMYRPLLRRIVMGSGVTAMKISKVIGA